MNLDKYLEEIQTEPVQEIAPILVVGGIASAIFAGVRLYKDYFTKNARRCADLPVKEKVICIMSLKVLGKRAQLNSLKKSLSKCDAKIKPKCQEKLGKKIGETDQDVKVLLGRLVGLKKQPAK